MNDHAAIQKLLAAYCGGDLAPVGRQRVVQHLADCPDCCAELADLQTALRLLRSTPEVEPPPWLTGRVMAHLREQHVEKKNWLQRLFLPLHIKLPLEVIALLTVCVSGYYLTRSVETGLQQATVQQFQEQTSQPAAGVVKEDMPAPAKKRDEAPARAVPPQSQPKVETPPIVPPPQTAPVPPVTAPSPSPSVDRARPESKVESVKPLPAAESLSRPPETAPERRAKSSRRLETSSGATVDRAVGAPGGVSLLSVTVRLSVSDPATAPAMVREAVLRSGGTIVKKEETPPRLEIRLPASRQNELLGRLERLGRITSRPAPPSGGAELLEMTIQW